jgi:hypothetical protein
MRRRSFLKLALGAAALAALPLKPKAAPPVKPLPWRYVVVADYGFMKGLPYFVDNHGCYSPMCRDLMKVVDYKPGTSKCVGTIIVDRMPPDISMGDVLVGI